MKYSTYSLLFLCSFVIAHLFSLMCTNLSLCTQNLYFPLTWSEKGHIWRVKKWWWSELFNHSHQAIQFIHVTDLHITYVFIFNTLLITNAVLVWELEIIWLGLGNKTTVLGLKKNFLKPSSRYCFFVIISYFAMILYWIYWICIPNSLVLVAIHPNTHFRVYCYKHKHKHIFFFVTVCTCIKV